MKYKVIEREGYPVLKVRKVIESYKPQRNQEGALRYRDALVYLARIISQDDPSFRIILSLASYSVYNQGLTKKQRELADRVIAFYEEKGVL